MSSLKYAYKVTRIEQCLIAGLATWLIALLSNGPLWFNQPKLIAAGCMFFSFLGGSLLHYGMRAEIYKLKHWDRVIVTNPARLKAYGVLALAASIGLSTLLPAACFIIASGNFLIILLYSNLIGRYWPWKNLTIAFVCLSPILIGWWSGHRLHPIVPPLIGATFCIYMTREIMKDVMDITANRGKRFTMAIALGEKTALRVGGLVLCLGLLLLINAIRYASHSVSAMVAIILALALFFSLMVHLLRRITAAAKFYRAIDFGILLLMFSAFCLRAGLP